MLVFLVGVDIHMAGVTVRSHSAVRVLAGAAALVLVRWRFGIASYPTWIMRIAMLTAICGSVETWFRFLLATIGGADSYGYVSASRMIASGRLIDPAPIARWLSAANRLAHRVAARVDAGAGWHRHRADVSDRHVVGDGALHAHRRRHAAVFFVAPVMGAITLWLVYRLARDVVRCRVGAFRDRAGRVESALHRLREAADERHAGDDVGHAGAAARGPIVTRVARSARGSPPAPR